MATNDSETKVEGAVTGSELLTQNLGKIEELSSRLVNALSQKRPSSGGLSAPGHDLYMKAAAAYMSEMMTNPSKIIENQISYWSKSVSHYIEAQQSLMQGRVAPPEDNSPADKRFANPLWSTHPYFNYIKQQYLFSAQAVEQAVADLEGLDAKDRKRIEYFSRQIVDMFSPTNFLGTNPEALARAVETEGQSLVDGLENLVRDIESGEGELQVTLADKNAFSVGENIATAKGSVVFRNELFELIQYAPTTEKVHETPLVIFPPWINKFYILDLKEKNSLVRWIVDQGFTLFVVSWKNPDASYADYGLGDYIEKGYLTAFEEAKRISGTKTLNAVGYCIAGTTLSMTLALKKARGEEAPINAATLFTTLTDFSDQGEVGVFLDNDFVDGIEHEVAQRGVLSSFFMARTFSFLRSNDLIYGPAIRSYMMGEAPPAFDLLYWNGDGTNLPAKMAVEYLRGLCQGDRFASDGFEILGERLHISQVDVPLCAIACETDHIAAWKSSYSGVQKMGGDDKMFILSESGHIAGIVNPPSRDKYGHYTNGDWSGSAADWQKAAEFTKGSWWPRWGKWLAGKSGAQVTARKPGDNGVEILGPAPGIYVTEKPKP
ncbi:class I poly(R)-hydroxyalkanoic acid synthase [Profundibacterium mesophilum]|uniref:Poly-beta-hydroxybutyrate synthase n=1 Tax=Profundibacterium mesophilum KAUST100406-0324 TaxID=1037889 RepID=A0A921TE52_9RHOB|nr:class I poly(R)-hydroxyalkanoic acid synthase [Profundibacterium mesophilum]KAF0676996.1 Poly-beta-hydroxybutyrate synthase [Profundibacterium mesophilum KAUST100406-0324]